MRCGVEENHEVDVGTVRNRVVLVGHTKAPAQSPVCDISGDLVPMEKGKNNL